MASRLSPCPSCTRHVKVGSASCPFCGGEVPTDVPLRATPAGRPLSRAALLFAGAAAVSACSSSTTGPAPSDAAVSKDTGSSKDSAAKKDSPSQGFDDGSIQALYGVAFIPDADRIPPEDDGGVHAAYGVFVDAHAVEPEDGAILAAYGGFASPDADGK